jgi:nicotinate-nucleotide pyrophosphorylase (carboxylating)
MRMSGIATLTSLALNIAREVNPSIKIASTRKTTPGFSYFEKKAVEIGGGDTHRFRLDDLVLIKDNHIVLVGDVEQAVRLAKQKTSFSKKIEVEITTSADIVKVVDAGADIVMLDNMSVAEVKQAIELLAKKGFRKNALLEISGGITLENLAEYAETGVDIISMGVLTHSYTSLNMSLEIIS